MTIEQKFRELKVLGQAALIPYITAGYPSFEESLDVVGVFSDCGADIIEIGVPFSDPIADGPAIQRSSQAALRSGVTLGRIIGALVRLKCATPLVLMSYLNPILAYGEERVFADMARTGISGLIIPDLPVDESSILARRARDSGLALILMAAPTSPEGRLRMIADHSRGFVYCVSSTATTGVRAELPPGLMPFLRRVRNIAGMPVAVGFGISRPEQVRELSAEADGVVIGSRIIEAIDSGEDLGVLVRSFKQATRR